jgi:recombination protein RecA
MVEVEVDNLVDKKAAKTEKPGEDVPAVTKDKKYSKKDSSKKTFSKGKDKEPVEQATDVKSAVKALEKSLKGRISFKTKEYTAIPTGVLILDYVIGLDTDPKGYPRGRIMDIFGWESTGKTTLMTQACIEAQKLGMTPAYIDYEQVFDEDYAVRQGINMDKLAYTRPQVMEDLDPIMTQYIKAGSELIVVDSVPAMTTTKTMEGEKETLAEKARYLAQYLPKWNALIAQYGSSIMFINQMRANIGGYVDSKATGGKALPFYSSVRIELSVVNKESRMVEDDLSKEKEKFHSANIVKATVVKNKVGMPSRSGEFRIVLGQGIDNMHTLRSYGEKRGFVSVNGANISYTSPNNPSIHISAMGKANFDQHFLDSPALFDDLRKAIGL